MMNYNRAIRRAYEIYTNREKYCYLYGAKKQIVTRNLIETMIKEYPEHFKDWNDETINAYYDENAGKIAVDCSGFIALCFDEIPANYSTGYFKANAGIFDTIAHGVAGALLYTTFGGKGRHIGIDVGSGFCIHSANEWDGIRLDYMPDLPANYWEYSFLAGGVDYTGACATSIYNE